MLGVEVPDVVKGHTQNPFEGISFSETFADADATTPKETQFYSMLGTRAIWHKGWKAVTAVPAAPESWGDFHLQPGSCTTPRRTRVSATIWDGAAREASGTDRALVGGGGRAPGSAA